MAENIEKHWHHVDKSVMRRLVCIKSAAWIRTNCPSAAGSLHLPLAGGSSEKSIYRPARICSANFLVTAGRPGAEGTVCKRAGWLVDPLPWLMVGNRDSASWTSMGGALGRRLTASIASAFGNCPSLMPV